MTNIGTGRIASGTIGNPAAVVGSSDTWILRPIADDKQTFSGVTPAGPGWSTQDDPTSIAGTPDLTDYIESSTDSQIARFELPDVDIGTRTVSTVNLWCYATIPTGHSLSISFQNVSSGGTFTKPGGAGGFTGWFGVSVSGMTAADVKSLRLQVQLAETSATASFTRVYACYAEVNLVSESDTTPPTPNIVSVDRTSISGVSGFDAAIVTWTSSEAFQHYKLKVVSSGLDVHTAGTLIEQDQNPAAGGTAGTEYASTITEAELIAASPAEGAKIVKLFVQDLAGNWST
jgi:hypothetical protein